MIDSLIFDLDGTLWDTTEALAVPWTETLNKHGVLKTLTQSDMASVMGKTVRDIAEQFMPELDEEIRIKITYEACDAEIPYIRKYGGKLYPELEETLCKLSKKYKLFIVSNCEDSYINAFWDMHGLKKYFIDAEYIGKSGKPKDENIKTIIEKHNLKAPAYVGDTLIDYEASAKNSIPFVFASYGFGNSEHYAAKLNTFSDLLVLCEKL